MSFEPLDHAEASLLLPWLGTDRLAQGELEGLLDHLKVCAPCRAELRDLADLGRFAELAEREEAPDAPAIEARLAGVLGRLEQAPPAPAARRRHWARVLPFAALVVLAAGLWAFRGERAAAPEPAPAGPYATLSDAPPSGTLPETALRVVVAEGCSQAELRGLLLAAGAEIRGGPTRHGVYTLGLPAGGAPAEAVIAQWRPLPCFSFVEKAAGS